ncbi:MAG TPA: fluoride efflux transporter CrcB [Phycisphaerales bacterium]|nr:fluoride efflux transporter CrcB [Phycisphaerales bacterium]
MVNLLIVFVGAGLGGMLRYALGGAVQQWWGPSFPVGTLVVNVSGCLAIGALATLFTGPLLVREEVKLFVLIGVLGGYTTFSSFGRETMSLIGDGEWMYAVLNVVLSNAAGLAAVWMGSAVVTRVYGTAGMGGSVP